MGRFTGFLVGLVAAAGLPAPVQAWSAHGHRTITYLALDGLGPEMPAFLREEMTRAMVAEGANAADRWRSTRLPALSHENNPDHFLDVDLLPQFGLTLETVSPLRREYLRDMAVAKHTHPEGVDPYDAAKDPNREYEWPGFALHAVAEHYAKLRSAMNELRVLEAINDPLRAHQVALARSNVVYHMGMLSHFVGDLAQPLHTTKHHHGWVGENPRGYTTDRGFHAYIDGGIVDFHGLTYAGLRGRADHARSVDSADPWGDTLVYLRRSFGLVEPLYHLQKTGDLREAAGKAFIEERFLDAAAQLGAMYRAAWAHSEPTEGDIQNFLRFNDFKPELLPWTPGDEGERAPEGRP